MKRLGVVVAVAAAALAIWYLRRPRQTTAAPTDHPPAALSAPDRSPSGAPSSASPGTPRRLTRVTKLDAAQRRALAERIASSQAARAATRAPERPQLPEPSDEPRITPTDLRAAMRELIPHLRECYEAALPALRTADVELTASISLGGDPDIGTLIDAKQIIDNTGQPLPAAFDDCLRSTFQAMALPPLAEGDKLDVRYPFKFTSN